MDRLGPERPDLVGFSIGGWIAAELATKAPERLNRLVLIGPVGVKTGTPDKNRALSHRRANSIMFHLKESTKDPELDKKVGLLWLGNEYAQLSKDYCTWPSSREGKKCDDESINRSAFVSWVDCRL
jgi:pimeloyl-ACP methyl ester carboxylesterase